MADNFDNIGDSKESGVVNEYIRQALRRFSGTIAHDFNNLLTMLLAYPQLIQRDLPEGSQGHDLLNIMEENAELMTTIAGRLANFALPANYAKHPIMVDEVVNEVLSDFDDDNLSIGVNVLRELESDAEVMMPHDVLINILKEIVTNAFESLDGSGELTVKTAIKTVRKSITYPNGVVAVGRYAHILVHDTGKGMDSDIREKAFEPFFSGNKNSKARGSGLGLSIAYAMATDCGGHIIFEDEEEGFTLSVLIPLSGQDNLDLVDEDDAEAEESKSDVSNAPLRVLVVDDEKEIVELFKLMLSTAIKNVNIDVAYNGQEALEAFKKHNYKVIVMDLHMPIMDGCAAFNELKRICREDEIEMPGVVFCTGYIPPDGVKEVVSGDPRHSLLQKPVTIKSLIKAVQERLQA